MGSGQWHYIRSVMMAAVGAWVIPACVSDRDPQRHADLPADSVSVELYRWQGDDRSLDATDKVYEYLGGRRRWAAMRALYVHYLQSDDALGTYPSIQYQSMDEDRIIVDQLINERRFVRILDRDLAWIINDGELTDMDETNREFLVYWQQLDFFRKMHRLAVGEGLRVLVTNELRLFVMEGDDFLFALQLDGEFRPKVFQRPRFNDQNISLRLLEWSSYKGYRYPSRGEAVEGDFQFTIRECIPAFEPPEEAFEVPFNPEYLDAVFEYGLKPFGGKYDEM